jgi:hypothetical protein
MSNPRFAILSFLAFLQIALACADRSIGLDDEIGDETGEQPQNPFDPGGPYSECLDWVECDSNWCLSPLDEPGFCTEACHDVEDCDASVAGTAEPTCLPVEGDHACALDCGGGRTCPPGMRCEQVDAEGPRSICF